MGKAIIDDSEKKIIFFSNKDYINKCNFYLLKFQKK